MSEPTFSGVCPKCYGMAGSCKCLSGTTIGPQDDVAAAIGEIPFEAWVHNPEKTVAAVRDALTAAEHKGRIDALREVRDELETYVYAQGATKLVERMLAEEEAK